MSFFYLLLGFIDPADIINLEASSKFISKNIKSFFGTISKKPLVGLGVVGTKTLINRLPLPTLFDISPLLSPVAKPTDQRPFLGYSRSTIFFDLLLLDVKFFVNCPKPVSYTHLTLPTICSV